MVCQLQCEQNALNRIKRAFRPSGMGPVNNRGPYATASSAIVVNPAVVQFAFWNNKY